MIKKTLIAGLLSGITITSALAADAFNIQIPDITKIIPQPPKPGTLVYQNDMDISHASFFVKDAKRYKLAQSDADDSTQGFVKTFEQAFGHPISEKATPTIWNLLSQLQATAVNFAKPAKLYYNRIRPFAYFHEKPCVPTGNTPTSYPSGHTTVGWAIALTLSQINPARATQIMQKGYEFGQSRVVCGAHFPSDVNAGYLVGATMFSQLQDSPKFQQEVKQAKQEIAQK